MDKESKLTLHLRDLLREVVKQRMEENEETVNFQYLEDINAVVAFIGEKKVGALRVKPFKDGYQVDSVIVSPQYRRLGIGKELYRVAFENLHSLYSDMYQTPDAKEIWKSLIRSGEAEEFGQRYRMK